MSENITISDKLRNADSGKVTIVVWGDVCLDEYIYGQVRAITREAPVPALSESFREKVPGQAGNVAHNLTALGCGVRLVSCWGEDVSGERLRELFSATETDISESIISESVNTTHRIKLVNHSPQRGYYHLYHIYREGICPDELAGKLVENFILDRSDCQAFVISDYSLGVLSERLVGEVIGRAKEMGIPMVANTRGSIFMYKGVSGIVCNLEEVSIALGGDPILEERKTEQVVGGAHRLLAEQGWEWMLVTGGGEGMFLIDGSGSSGKGEVVHLSPCACKVVDITGAGDTVVAAMAFGLGLGWQLEEAMQLANLAAGVVVGKPGTSTATSEEIESLDKDRSL